MSKNPPIMRSAAVNFQLRKSTPRKTVSTTALMGIPRTVPRDMKRGKVYAIPKLMLKLKATPRAELAQRYPQGMSTSFSAPV